MASVGTMANCCCEDCLSITCGATKQWPHYAPFPNHVRGTYRLEYGYTAEQGTEFYRRVGWLFDLGFFANDALARGTLSYPLAGSDTEMCDLDFLVRYLHASYSGTGTSRAGSEPTWTDTPFSYAISRTWDKDSGVIVAESGTNSCGTYRTYALDDDGNETDTGSIEAFVDCPISSVPQFDPPNWGLALQTVAGSWAEISINAEGTDALLTIHLPAAVWGPSAPSDIEYTSRITFSLPYALEDYMADVEAMLDTFDLDDLSHDYGVIVNQPEDALLHWSRGYMVEWNHGPGVPKALQYRANYGSPPVHAARLAPFPQSGSPAFTSPWGHAAKSLYQVAAGTDYSWFTQEQALPTPATTETPDDSYDGLYPSGIEDCVQFHSNTMVTEQVVPADVIFPFGTLYVARTCAGGESICMPAP